jgi:hypothetical protein
VAGVLVGTGALAGTAAGGATATGELTALGAGVDLDRPLTVAAVSVGLTSAASIDRGIAEVRSETVGVGSMEGVEGP